MHTYIYIYIHIYIYIYLLLSLLISRDQTEAKLRLAGVDSGRKEMGRMSIKYLLEVITK